METIVKKVLPIAGKVLVALPALFFGIGHLSNGGQMAGMVPVPGGVFWVYFTGICLIAGAVGLFIPKVAQLAGVLLGVLILIFAFAIHAPHMGGAEGQGHMMNFFKDLGIAGGAWLVAVLASKS